jgi:hypothetical protein
MKNTCKYLGLFLILFFATLNANNVLATVWRVNNRAGVNADFASLTEAQNSSSVIAGDTLYLEASSASHGNVTLTKRLVIIGPGFFLAENPETQADINSAKIDVLTLNNGSQGSVIKGCSLYRLIINTSNILFEGNYVISSTSSMLSTIVFGENVNNIILRNNYIRQLYVLNSSEAIRAQVTGVNNVTISNNYIEVNSTVSGRYSLYLSDGFSGTIENNVLYGSVTVNNSNFHNNILITGAFYPTNTNYTHNIGNTTQFGSLNGNQQNVVMSNVFVGSAGNSTDGQWKLAGGSPAIGAGVDGVDCGMFGGSNPYRLSGLPNIPSIYQLNHTLNYPAQQIEVEFSVKSNNN